MHKHTTHILTKGSTWLTAVLSLLWLVACTPHNAPDADALNDRAYAFHYRNLDSTRVYALRARAASDGYDAGQAEALNHLAFYHIARMEYDKASLELDSIKTLTDNEIELLIAAVQQMRLCQRRSHNKDFYDFREEARRRLQRIDDEHGYLTPHAQARLVYARSELAVVTSTYYYYVGLEEPSIRALQQIDPEGEVRTDTAQLLNYYYNVGAGGIIVKGTAEEIAQEEFDKLLTCYVIARRQGYTFWEANALQSLSEHLAAADQRERLIRDNLYAMKYINVDQMPDSLLAGNLAQRSLDLFRAYGDVYQTAGSYRTLASCYWQIQDYMSALICLQDALFKNPNIEQAPDLVASIHEQLSLVYSAVDDKPHSDEHRNLYLDLHQQTRQDRFLESRAEQLDQSSLMLNAMIFSVASAIVLLTALLFIFNLLRQKNDRKNSVETLLNPLEQWKERNAEHLACLEERFEEVQEAHALATLHIADNKRRSLEQRAKISLVNSVMPFIDRMLHEIRRLRQGGETDDVRRERYAYISEIINQIDDTNRVLTEWIQLRQGALSLHIESFPVSQIFEVIARGQMSFQLKGLNLKVVESDAVVKADRVLTLFMVNTIADNARKFTPKGGIVTVEATKGADYVEISVSDTGQGMDESALASIFDHKVNNGHGFGLMNCKGIIEKYKKISQIFSVCSIAAESTPGRGSRFSFRLPKGVARAIMALLMLPFSLSSWAQSAKAPLVSVEKKDICLQEADRYADSAYYSNIRATYARTLLFADTCRKWLNRHYREQKPGHKIFIRANESGNGTPEEVQWWHTGVKTDYNVILDIRNESAVAALALHQWSVYRYNNKVYTQLFKEVSADRTLGDYCRQMQRSESNKNVAIVLLVVVLLLILPAYYVIYYRHVIHYRYCVERVKAINRILLSDQPDADKLAAIEPLLSNRFPDRLQDIVSQILQTLHTSVEQSKQRETDIEMADDERRRTQYEDERLHVSNAILDNCLSTLKHETMYYPSRIRQLVSEDDNNLQSIGELATYYKELYTILSLQAMKQVDAIRLQCSPVALLEVCKGVKSETADVKVLGDKVLLQLLFDTLQKQNASSPLTLTAKSIGSRYVEIAALAPRIILSKDACQTLFTPKQQNIPYLICRQIVRECGEATNLRGCGIAARQQENATTFLITLPRVD